MDIYTNQDYIEWLAEVDNILIQIYGQSHETLEYYNWVDAFQDGLTPREAVADYIDTRVLNV